VAVAIGNDGGIVTDRDRIPAADTKPLHDGGDIAFVQDAAAVANKPGQCRDIAHAARRASVRRPAMPSAMGG
jgi:hypothetical protein